MITEEVSLLSFQQMRSYLHHPNAEQGDFTHTDDDARELASHEALPVAGTWLLHAYHRYRSIIVIRSFRIHVTSSSSCGLWPEA